MRIAILMIAAKIVFIVVLNSTNNRNASSNALQEDVGKHPRVIPRLGKYSPIA